MRYLNKVIVHLLVFFTLVTFIHSLFLLYAKSLKEKYKLLKFLWIVHTIFNSILWLLLTLWILLTQFSHGIPTPSLLKIIGLIFCFTGLVLDIEGLRKLGFKQAKGYRFFSKEKIAWISSDIYSFLHNPIYDGFILILLGFGLITGIFADFYLAITSFFLLNIYLATIEKGKFKVTEIF